MSEPTFTVVIPAYNEGDLVPWAIRSVQAQSRPDWEAIVVDDGSSDDTAAVVQALASADRRIRLISKENAGLSAARNTAIEDARGRLISFLDADDMWMPGYLDAMARALDAEPTAGLGYTDAWALDADTLRIRRATAMSVSNPPDFLPDDPVEVMMLLVRQNFMWVSTTVTRAALDDAGLFREDLASVEDVELWLRILATGHTAVRPPGVLGIKRERAEAMSREDLKNIKNLQRVMGWVSEDERMPVRVRERALEKIHHAESWRLALTGESRWRSGALAIRLHLGRIRRATIGRRDWLREPPPEVQAAFPDLFIR